jgi:predicted PurR-regulated permease PerM
VRLSLAGACNLGTLAIRFQEHAMQDQNDSLGGYGSEPVAASSRLASTSRGAWPQVGTFILLAIAALYFARPLLLPLVLAVLLNLLLSPGVRGLRRIGLPLPLGAALVLLAALAALGLAAWQLAEPAADWIERAPRSVQQMQDKIRPLKQSVEQVQKATEQVEQVTQVGATHPVREVKVKGQSLLQQLMKHAQEIAVGAFMMLVLLYFLMASDDLFLRKVVRVFPRLRDKIRAVEIGRTIEREIGRYFLTYSLINVGVGAVVAAAMYALGMPNPLLWGVMVGVLNFVPYLGPVISLTVITAVSLLTFDTLQQAAWPPLAYLIIEGIEGNVVQTLAFGRSLALNPVAIFVALLFWGWLWGAAGILLAVPVLVAVKVACSHIDSLKPVAEFLDRN